jgi:hypothetical protein
MKFFDYAKRFEYAMPTCGFIVRASCEAAACGASAGCQQGRTNLPTVHEGRGAPIVTPERGEHFHAHPDTIHQIPRKRDG